MEVSQTLYINNLVENKNKRDLKNILYALFSQYGKVIEIVACKGIKLRGQAWIVFDDSVAASQAMKGKQGFNFYGKPMKIAFSSNKSNVVARKEGQQSGSSKVSKRSREHDDLVSAADPVSKAARAEE